MSDIQLFRNKWCFKSDRHCSVLVQRIASEYYIQVQEIHNLYKLNRLKDSIKYVIHYNEPDFISPSLR